MPDDTADESAAPSQLNQLRVPLEDAADAFAGPNPPMVLVPRYALRIRNGKPIETASRCSGGAWTFDGATLRFSGQIATAAPDRPMPLVLQVKP